MVGPATFSQHPQPGSETGHVNWCHGPQNRTILCVDDCAGTLELLRAMFTGQPYEVLCASSGGQALARLDEKHCDLVFLDVMMPGMNGFEVCRRVKSNPRTRRVPVVLITGQADQESRMQGLEAGADEFLSKPVAQAELLARTANLLKVKAFGDFLQVHNVMLQRRLGKKTLEVREALRETLYRLTLAAEHRDDETAAHLRRISHYTKFLGDRLGLSGTVTENLRHTSPMHDVGKIGIPDEILFKPGPLTPQEFEAMQKHTLIGSKILSGSHSPLLQAASEIALSHHERWDGTGYPFGLAGDAIPLSGRIVSLVDQYDALRSVRPYKPALSHMTVFDILTEGDGRTLPCHFDPHLLAAFRNCHQALEEIFDRETEDRDDRMKGSIRSQRRGVETQAGLEPGSVACAFS